MEFGADSPGESGMPYEEENDARYKALMRAHKVGYVCMDCPAIRGTYPLIMDLDKHNKEVHGNATC